MKIAYLMHTYCEFDEIVENINQLIKQGDHVFIIINDNELREQIYFVYAESTQVHIARIQEFAQEGDLSFARGTICQLKEAVESKHAEFDYYINLTDGMMPIVSRDKIVEVLSSGKDFFYIDEKRSLDQDLYDDFNKLYTFTNLYAFKTNKWLRKFCKANGTFLKKLGLYKKDEIPEKIFIGSPWFMLPHDTVKVLVDNFAYVSNTFKFSWFAEEKYIPIMIHTFLSFDNHENNDYRLVGPSGKWVENSQGEPIDVEMISANTEALFAAKIYLKDNFDAYQNTYNVYNSNKK